MDEITIGDKTYISSKQAAKITGYAKDYVGQLCREGRVEARLVGRNWYVLDSAIREHRFGKETAPEPVIEPEVPTDRVSTWKKPEYKAEVPVLVPNFSQKDPNSIGTPAIADMQSAWREWFEDKQSALEPLPNVPEGLSDGNPLEELADEAPEPFLEPEKALSDLPQVEERSEMVMVSRIQDTENPVSEEGTEPIDLHRIYTPRPVAAREIRAAAPRPRKEKKVDTRKGKTVGAGVIQALLIVVAITAMLIALIGTGHADQYLSGTSLDFGMQKQLVDFLGGKSVYESSL